jgi:hypothetical protein
LASVPVSVSIIEVVVLVTCAYFLITIKAEWPRIFCTTRISIPCSNKSVAAV